MATYLPNCQQVAEDIGKKYGLPPGLLYAQVYQESRCRVDAVGPPTKYGQAYGIAQIIPKFHPGVNPNNPTEALNYLAQWLSRHYSSYKNSWALSVASWHAGEPAVNKSQPCVPGTFDSAANIGTLQYVWQVLNRAGLGFDASKECGKLTGNQPTSSNPSSGGSPQVPSSTSSAQRYPEEESRFRLYLILGVAMLLIIFAVSRIK